MSKCFKKSSEERSRKKEPRNLDGGILDKIAGNIKPRGIQLDPRGFSMRIAEVKKIHDKKGPLSVTGLKNLREEHGRTIDPARALAAEALRLERQVRR